MMIFDLPRLAGAVSPGCTSLQSHLAKVKPIIIEAQIVEGDVIMYDVEGLARDTQVRFSEIDGCKWYATVDVATLLGYSHPSKAARRMLNVMKSGLKAIQNK